ncbi:hypothetical protein ACFOOM_04410 [Streptomyces echinoruber]|uniref:Uncharacterized protein n=1 Tax=Streptomyces echinoruber TaxID=68898 RepID=A0A918VNT3_9ACTN|nr:hypothetical protein [Streptomyces echinoruber]GHA13108.1 hypothetical protein GCM10010389_60040 [Streptomyces echinoruber]
MLPDHTPRPPAGRPTAVHHPTPIPPAPAAAPLVPAQPAAVPSVASIVLPDGRVVTGYALPTAHPEPAAKPAVSRTAVNVALGGVGFAAACGGLLLLTSFLTALAALVQQLIILAAVVFGGFIAIQLFGHRHGGGAGTTVHIRKAVIKRSHFRG